jgi:hypothetical protein
MKKIQLLAITLLFAMVSFFPTHASDKNPACKECKRTFKTAKKACKGQKGTERSGCQEAAAQAFQACRAANNCNVDD